MARVLAPDRLLTLLPLLLVDVAAVGGPIVGVLTVPQAESPCPTEQAHGEISLPASGGGSCMSALYVKYIEAAGGRVVPILYDWSDKVLEEAFGAVNAVFFTGGGVGIRHTATRTSAQYLRAASLLYNMTVAANGAGEYIPLWGTCMGLQTLSIVAAGDQSVLESYAYDSEGISLPLEVTPAAQSSRLFSSMPAHIFRWVTSENMTSNLHHDGVLPETYASNKLLASTFSVLSTNVDRKGKPFVSTIEARQYPIYAVQWHPERPAFMWEPAERGIDHSGHAVESMQFFANFFVNEARNNSHRFADATSEREALIYNHVLVGRDSYSWYEFSPAHGSAGAQGHVQTDILSVLV